MKKIQQVSLVLITALTLFIYSCAPNGDKNPTDTENSEGEGAIDSTKIPDFDSAHASDSPHASLSHPHFRVPSDNTNNIKFLSFKKPR